MGQRHGAFTHYHPDSSAAKSYSWFENDTQQWIAFPWELESYLVPVKGWSATHDSTEIRVPYVSGPLLYQGSLNLADNIMDRPYGTHHVYYPDGSVKAAIDYDKDSMSVYSRSGQLMEVITPQQWRWRQMQ